MSEAATKLAVAGNYIITTCVFPTPGSVQAVEAL